MTDRLRAAAQAALDVLFRAGEELRWQSIGQVERELRAALAEPTCKQDLQVAEQDAEPFLWYDDETGETWTPDAVVEGWAPTDLRPLYVSPVRREWAGLTDEEIASSLGFGEHTTASTAATLRAVASAIEAALKEKNA